MNRLRRKMRPGRAVLAASTLLSLVLLLAAVTRATAQTFLRGDTNADGIVDVSDGVSTVLYLFGGGRTPPCLDAADTDDSGEVDVTDAVYTYDFLFAAGSQIPAPGHLVCGLDPTPDALSCEHSPACEIPESLDVGPEGGQLEFSSGVVIDVPPGAVSDLTSITLSSLPGGIDTLLNDRSFASSDKRSLGGFVVSVDGSAIQLPAQASIPVAPIEPGGFPHLARVDLASGEYWLIPGDLTYFPAEGRVEVDLASFFDSGDGAGGQEVHSSGDGLVAVQLSGIPTDAPCRSGKITVVSMSKDTQKVGPGLDCGIVSDIARVTFHDCLEAPTEIVYIGEIAGPEPSKCDFVVDVHPKNQIIAFGDTVEFHATAQDRNTGTYFPADFIWASSDPNVVHIDAFTGVAVGASDGDVVITARTGAEHVKGTTRLAVVDYAVTVRPAGPIEVGDTEQLTAFATDPEGRLVPSPPLEWHSFSPVLLVVDDNGLAEGIAQGTASVRACLEDPPICSRPIPICVANRVDRIVITPGDPLTTVGGLLPLRAAALDAAGQTIPCGPGTGFSWSIDNRSVARFESSPGGPAVRLKALAEGQTTVTVRLAGMQPATATVTIVPVPQFSADIEPDAVTIGVGGGAYFKAVGRDLEHGGVLFSIDPAVRDPTGEMLPIPYSDPDLSFTLIHWLSSDPLVAPVDKYGKVHGVSPGTAQITATILPERSFHNIPSESASAWVHVENRDPISDSSAVELIETDSSGDVCNGVFLIPPRLLLRVTLANDLLWIRPASKNFPYYHRVPAAGEDDPSAERDEGDPTIKVRELGDPSTFKYSDFPSPGPLYIGAGDIILLWDHILGRYSAVRIEKVACGTNGMGLLAHKYIYRDWLDLPEGWYDHYEYTREAQPPWDFSPGLEEWPLTLQAIFEASCDQADATIADGYLSCPNPSCVVTRLCSNICDSGCFDQCGNDEACLDACEQECNRTCNINPKPYLDDCGAALLDLVICAIRSGCGSVRSNCAQENCWEEFWNAF